ncbi:hypothetical protein BH18ACT17_BH18ACT17_11600 [soil metagenome]
MPISLRGTTPRGFGVETIELFRTRVARARTRRVTWQRFGGFVGERNEHEGRCVMLTTDGSRLQAPGTLDPDEMDSFWSQAGRFRGRSARSARGAGAAAHTCRLIHTPPGPV